jgi:ATP-binding cassette, subfamily B, multidrug efflux pump
VTERGLTLSTGQRQLISFCRAFAVNPEILILDEATSNIDSETEQVIEKSLEILLKDRTSIVIAHRLSTIKRANKIIVLHHGKTRETGTHSELLSQNGIYARLYNLQYKEKALLN